MGFKLLIMEGFVCNGIGILLVFYTFIYFHLYYYTYSKTSTVQDKYCHARALLVVGLRVDF